MVKVWHGMTGDELPAPEDLSQEEISAIIDPAATGVPELSPINTLYREKQAWEAKIETLEGEDKYIAMGEMARCLGHLDPLKAYSLAKQVLAKAAENNWMRARAEAYRASGLTLWFLLGVSLAERQTNLSNAIELFSFLELKVRKAEVMLHHALFESLVEGGFKRVTAKVWEARQLLLEPSDDESLRHAALGIASHICAIIAWQSERDFELARGYWAIAVLHFRKSSSPFLVGLVHRAMGLVLIDQMKFSTAKPHQIRASQIYHHNEMWNLYVIDCGRIATTQIKMGDLDGARRSLVQLKQVMIDKSITRNKYSLEYVEGYIKLPEKSERTIQVSWCSGVSHENWSAPRLDCWRIDRY
ncbi:MAG: hypothetical protein HN368_12635 [Spirochaetales bacterium]|jgi:hypothetical protein|nr:hypothetical protein [Spirochaetales bacterium]